MALDDPILNQILDKQFQIRGKLFANLDTKDSLILIADSKTFNDIKATATFAEQNSGHRFGYQFGSRIVHLTLFGMPIIRAEIEGWKIVQEF